MSTRQALIWLGLIYVSCCSCWEVGTELIALHDYAADIYNPVVSFDDS